MTTEWRKKMTDGPVLRFTYMWTYGGPHTYDVDLSGTGCQQTIIWNRIATVHTLDRGDYKRYLKGFQMEAKLRWSGNHSLNPEHFDDEGTVPGLNEKLMQLLFNTTCEETVLYWPHPSTHPSTYYNVIWSGDYDFNYIDGLVGTGFQGEIQLIGKDILERSYPFTTNWGT